MEIGRDITEVELLATCLLDASYIVKSTLDIAYVHSMSVNSACVVGGARRVHVGPPL